MDLLIIKPSQERINEIKKLKLQSASELEKDIYYHAVRSAWRLNIDRAGSVDYILAVVDKKVKDVFVAKEWKKAEDKDGRYEFDGDYASDKIRKLFKNFDLPEKFRRKGAANPIFYATEDDFEKKPSIPDENQKEPKYRIKAIISSINIKNKTFKIKGSDGYYTEDESKEKWNLLKNGFEILPLKVNVDVISYDNKIDDLWVLVSNAFESRQCLLFDVKIGDDESIIVESISQIDD